MNLLLDTRILLGWLDDSELLTSKVRRLIADGKNPVFVCAVNIWEVRIKQSSKKLRICGNFRELLERQAFDTLPVTVDHAHTIERLPKVHRDPFDRMLIAQAMTEGFSIVTHDRVLRRYGVSIVEKIL